MKKNNFKIIKIDKSKSLFNYEKKVLINELILEERCTSRQSYFKLLNINVFSFELFIVDLKEDGIATLFFESIIP